MARPLVVLDLAAGRALLGGTVAVVRARPGGAIEFGGCVIRPLRFGERWRVVDGAATDRSDGSDGSLGASVLAVAAGAERADGSGPGDDRIARAIALHLAGARPGRTVPGCAAQLAALVAAGWSTRDVLDADADLIDLLTVESDRDGGGAGRSGGGWTSIVLVDDADGDGLDGDGLDGDGLDGDGLIPLADLLRVLERDLLGRLVPAGDGESAGSGEPTARAGDGDRIRAALAAVATGSGSHAAAAALDVQRAGSAAASPGRPAASHPTGRFPADAPARAAASSAPLGEPNVVGRDLGPSSSPKYPAPIRTDWPGARPTNGVGAAPSVAAAPSDRAERPTLAPAAPWSVRPATALAPGEPVARRATLADASAAPVVVHDDAAASRTDRLAFPAPARPDAFDVADEVAALLDEESDLRGLRR